ncbi:RE2 [Symbiodinium sp. CCMP2592]|nr:RE2 [Symbiodinium sp. CCMP2592]
MNSGDKDSSWLKCQWNGDPGGWADFLRCVRLAFEKTSRRKRHLLGPEIVGQLSGRAWVVTQELDHRQLVRRDGVVYLIEFLRDRLCKTPIPDVGLRLEQLMIRLRRHPGTSMATWATQLRDAYRQLQLALARARKGPRAISSPSPTSTPTKTRSSRRTSQGTLEEPHAEEPTEGEQDETETLPGAPDDEELRRDEEGLSSSPASRTSESRPPRRKRRDSDSDDSVKALADLEIWSRYEEKLEEVLPSELLGWLLLRRAGLSAQARLSVQAASGNSLKLDRVEGALRGMEDELLAQEQTRTPHPAGRRRSFWVEDEGHWSILLADDDDLSESLEGIPTHYVGDENAFNVWAEDEEYGDESWTGSSDGAYWGDELHGWTPEEDPANILTAEELQQVEEAYQAADSKLRTFVDARKAVRARHLSRGFYPFAPQNKGFRSQKGKGKMRSFPKGKGKGKKGATPTSPVASLSVPVLMSESPTFAVSPGQAGYSGCFICGDRSHQFRDCPRRSTKGPAKGSGKVHFHTEPEVYMVQASFFDFPDGYYSFFDFPDGYYSFFDFPDGYYCFFDFSDGFHSYCDYSGNVPMVYEDTTVDVPDMILVQKSVEEVAVTNAAPKRFKFGNGHKDFASVAVSHRDILVMGAVDPNRGIQLQRSVTGHLLLDLRQVPVNADAFRLEETAAAPPSSKSTDKNEEQFVTSGKEAAKAKPKKGGYKSQPLDWDRTVESDPRDPRHSGPPCNGEHVPARMFKGSPSGSNQYGQWIACERCLLRLSYTPRAGCHALHRSPGALPKDVQSAVKEELPNLTTLKDKDIGWAAAEKSAEDNLMRVRQARMSQQAGQRGAVPKRLAQKEPGPKATPATSAPPTSSPTPTSPTSSLGTSTVVVDVEEVIEGMHAHPGRKAVKRNEEAAEEMIENLAASYVHERDYSMATIENFLKQLRAAHAVPQRKFMDKKTTTSFVVSYGLYAHGSQCGVMNSTFQNPQLSKYVNQWLQAWAPSSAHWTTFSIVYNMESKPHRDLHNLKGQPNYVITFGEHEHGELWLEGTSEDSAAGGVRRRKKPNGSLANGRLLSPHHQVISFDADQWHATMPWRGTRIALAAYTARSFRGLDPELRRALLQVSFPLPRPSASALSVCDDQTSPTETCHLSVDERQAIFNDFEEYQDLLLENFETEDDDARLFGLEICCATASKLRDELQSRGERVQTLGFAEGGDLGTNHGAELVKSTILRLRPRWLICHVPLGPTRKNKEDDMSSPPWRRFNKVVRHLLETAQVQINNGGEVLWCQPAESSARLLSCVRAFWYQHQQHADGRVMKCGETHYRSTSTTLLQGLPSVSEAPPDLEKMLAKLMQQVIRYEAVFSFVGAVDMSVLEGISSKELGELMERVHRLHSRLGHPSNRLLVKNLQARHADKRLIAAASQLKCDACLESRIKAPRPPVDLSRSDRLWTDLQMDLFQMKIDDRIYHFLLFVDECSGYAVIRLVFDHSAHKGGNATSAQVCHLLEEAWTQYFGFPERIKLDAESALRGTLLRDWCATRGVELVHAPAEHHQFISEVERSIGTLRRKIETFLRERPEHPRQVALSMVTSHNSLARIHGFSPLQWALGRDLSLSGHVNEGTGELPALSSAGTPGADLHQTQRMRLRAAQAFLELRHKELSDRAARSSASAYPHYLPGDLIYYRRYKTPQDLPANMSTDHPRMTISRWYGPARVLATESRGAPGERRPSSHLWVIAQGRLKKCHYTQVRPASETEHLVAQQSSGTTFPWTMSNLTSLLNKGAYEDLTRDRAVYPDDLEFPDEDDRDDGPLPGADDHVGNGDQTTDLLSDEELIPAASSAARKREGPEPVEEEEMVPDNAEIDLNKLFNDPSYMPFQPIPASALVSPYPRDSFREQRARHEQDDRPWHVRRNEGESLYHVTEEADKVFAVTIDAPADAQAWKKMVKHPEKFMSKAVSKGVEVSWQRLSAEQRSAMAEAKSLEVAQWVQLKVCKRVAEHVPESQLLRMRWVLTFKEADPTEAGNPQVKAKARIVILGYSDPGLLEDTTASPTMSKLTRQLMLNLACIRRWAIYSADVRTAFLQARPTDRGRRLLAKPLPELAEKLGLTPQECVELTGSAYGLATAPKEWFADVSSTLKKLGALQCRTDPCAWIVLGVDGEVAGALASHVEVAGALASHVDDFLIMGSATDANWLRFIAAFKAAYSWAPWQQGDFVHCGIRILQHEDGSMTLDHSGFCADLVQMDPAGPGETMTENQVRQAKAILGSAQWRVTQSAPHHAAKLSYLQTLLSSRSSSCVDQINKLVREIHNAKHISISVQNLGDFDPKTATFVAWSDASLANRPDGTSTGGLLVGMMSPKSMELGQGKINVISWRSYKLPRVARSSLSAEAQALSNCEQELMYARLAWFELNGGKVDVNNPAAGTSQVPGHLIIDARGVYDTLMKADPGMASFNVKDKYTSLELMGISENLQSQGTILNWCDSDHQLADGLTKSAKQDVLKKFLLQGRWRLRHPGAFMSAKRRRVLDGNQRLVTPRHVTLHHRLLYVSAAQELLCGSSEPDPAALRAVCEKRAEPLGCNRSAIASVGSSSFQCHWCFASDNAWAFAAKKSDGSVATWGDSRHGGDSSSVSSRLTSGVDTIYSTDSAFAARKSDGSVVTWGSSCCGGDSSSVSSQLTSGVDMIYSTASAFAAKKSDGSVVTWGSASSGGASSSVSGVDTIYSTLFAFAAKKLDGSVVTWGSSDWGGDSSSVSSQLTSGVDIIYSTSFAFAAKKSDGRVVTWGRAESGGDSVSVSHLTSGVGTIYSNSNVFAAIKSDGSVVTWGRSKYGGDSSSVSSYFACGVDAIYSTGWALAAKRSDGSVVTWGSASSGGDSSSVSSHLTSGVDTIYSNSEAFAAKKSDGSVVTWGDSDRGGDSSSVSSQLTSGAIQEAKKSPLRFDCSGEKDYNEELLETSVNEPQKVQQPGQNWLPYLENMREEADRIQQKTTATVDIVVLIPTAHVSKLRETHWSRLKQFRVQVVKVPWELPPELYWWPDNWHPGKVDGWCGPQDLVRLHTTGLDSFDAVAFYDQDVEFHGALLCRLCRILSTMKLLIAGSDVGCVPSQLCSVALPWAISSALPVASASPSISVSLRSGRTGDFFGPPSSLPGTSPSTAPAAGAGEVSSPLAATLWGQSVVRDTSTRSTTIGARRPHQTRAKKALNAAEVPAFEQPQGLKMRQIDQCIWNYQTGSHCPYKFDCNLVKAHHKPTQKEHGRDCPKLKYRSATTTTTPATPKEPKSCQVVQVQIGASCKCGGIFSKSVEVSGAIQDCERASCNNSGDQFSTMTFPITGDIRSAVRVSSGCGCECKRHLDRASCLP